MIIPLYNIFIFGLNTLRIKVLFFFINLLVKVELMDNISTHIGMLSF